MPENGEKLRKNLKKPIDKREKMRYNLNEPNGSERKSGENRAEIQRRSSEKRDKIGSELPGRGGQDEIKEHHLLCDDS